MYTVHKSAVRLEQIILYFIYTSTGSRLNFFHRREITVQDMFPGQSELRQLGQSGE
jgi:hypothetical protein